MTTITGDLLTIERGILLHQTNCLGVTGGLAGALRRKYPHAFDPYFAACERDESPAGQMVIGEVTPQLFIAHIFGQLEPGANTDLSLVSCALENLAAQLAASLPLQELPCYAPYLMGCGLGGGRWEKYLPLLENYFPQLTIVKLEKQDR